MNIFSSILTFINKHIDTVVPKKISDEERHLYKECSVCFGAGGDGLGGCYACDATGLIAKNRKELWLDKISK